MFKLILVISLVGICLSDPIPQSEAASGLYCDTLLCPATSNACTITKSSSADLSKIVTTRQCKQGGKVILSDKSETANTSGGTMNSSSTKSFSSSSSSSSSSQQGSQQQFFNRPNSFVFPSRPTQGFYNHYFNRN